MLVARQKQLRELTRLYDEVVAGGARCAVISGPVATGKSSLLRVFTRARRQAGARVLACKGSALGRDVPLGLIRQLTGVLAGGRAAEPTFRRPLPQALAAALADLAAEAPLVVSVDDAQYADPESMSILRDLLENPPDARVMFVIAESSNVGPAGAGFDVEALPGAAGTCLLLGLLDEPEVRAVVAQQVGPAVESDVLDVLRMGGGNPLLTRALITDLMVRPDPRLPYYRRAVARCLERGAPAALRVARAAAVLAASDADAGGLEPALDRMLASDAPDLRWALADLRATGLFDERDRFRHEVVRAVVLDAVPPEQLDELNARALQVRLSQGAPSRQLARHVVTAGRVRSRWEVDVLLDAGDQALITDEVEEVLEYLRLARTGPVDAPQRHRIAAATVRVWLRTNPGAVRGDLGPLVEAFAAGQLDDADASTLLRALGWNGEVERIAEVVERSGQDGRTQPGLPFLTACRALVSRYPTIRPVVEAMHGRLGPSADEAPAEESPWATDAALLGVPDGQDVAAGALRFLTGTPLTDATVDRIEVALLTAVAHGYVEQARSACDELLAEAARRGARTWTATLLAVRAEIALRLGDLPRAHHLAERSIAAMPGRAWGVAVCAPLATSVCSAVAMGDHAAAALRLETPVPNSAFQSRLGLLYLQARGRYYEATGQVAAAMGDFRFCAMLVREWGLDDPSVVPWRSDTARVHLRLGAADQARELLDEELDRVAPDDHRSRGRALVLRAEAADAFSRPRLLEQAVELLRRSGDRFLLQRAESALGRTGQPGVRRVRDAAPPAALRPTAIAQPVPEPPAVALAEARTRGLLTDCELRVAELAAQGRSNKEISRQAFITVSTVEQHLTKVYRKLRIRGRAELPACLQEARLDAAVS